MTPTAKARRPAKSILDPAFRYRPSHTTDVRETFERVRWEFAPPRAVSVVHLPARGDFPYSAKGS
jgi:hypothetical protein